jgi:hypothetical protein
MAAAPNGVLAAISPIGHPGFAHSGRAFDKVLRQDPSQGPSTSRSARSFGEVVRRGRSARSFGALAEHGRRRLHAFIAIVEKMCARFT